MGKLRIATGVALILLAMWLPQIVYVIPFQNVSLPTVMADIMPSDGQLYVGDTLTIYGTAYATSIDEYREKGVTVVVNIDGVSLSEITDIAGSFTFLWVPTKAGTYEVLATVPQWGVSDPYGSITVTVFPWPSSPKVLEVTLIPDSDEFYARNYGPTYKGDTQIAPGWYGCWVTFRALLHNMPKAGRGVYYTVELLQYDDDLRKWVKVDEDMFGPNIYECRLAAKVDSTGTYEFQAKAWGYGAEGWSNTVTVQVGDSSDEPTKVPKSGVVTFEMDVPEGWPKHLPTKWVDTRTGMTYIRSTSRPLEVPEGEYKISSPDPSNPIQVKETIVTVKVDSGIVTTLQVLPIKTYLEKLPTGQVIILRISLAVIGLLIIVAPHAPGLKKK